MSFVPLSQRQSPSAEFDGPHEGVPPWLRQQLLALVTPYLLEQRGFPDGEKLRALEVMLRLDPPLDWSGEKFSALSSFTGRFNRDEEFALNVVDWVLHLGPPNGGTANAVKAALLMGGSAWDAEANGQGQGQLVRRAIGPVREAIEHLSSSQRAHAHLVVAWNKLMGRNPDPSSAYREAIRAVEVVAAPVVLPNNPKATLGQVISALRDKPEKWTVDLIEASPTQVADMAAMIWQSQFDRHGTSDENVPLNVSQEQASAAVHVAISLVDLFAHGHIRPSF